MLQIHSFTFNPFQENTYVVYDETKECVIIDAGCYDGSEEQDLVEFIQAKQLKSVAYILTHCHIDHVLGNHFVFEKYGLQPQIHANEIPVLNAAQEYAQMFGVTMKESPPPIVVFEDGGTFKFGNTVFKLILAPGHSPGSICFYHAESNTLIAGDVLFQMSIGRSDLPLGDPITLIQSITTRLFTLPDDTTVYPGHGPSTTIGYEKENNPFLI